MTSRPRRRTAFAVLRGALLGLAAVLVVGIGLSSLGASPLSVLSVLSGSMAPTIDTGDAVVVQTVSPREVRIGDVVTFRDPADRSRLITHRLRAVQVEGERVRMTTKGDANDTVERWTMDLDGELGVVRRRVPRLGFVLGQVQSLPGRLLLLGIPALLLGLVELRRIWAPPRTEPVQLRLF